MCKTHLYSIPFSNNVLLTVFVGLRYNKDYGLYGDLQTSAICFILQSLTRMREQSTSMAGLTYDVVAAVRAGVMLQQPRIHTLLVKPVSAGNDTQFLQEQMKEH